MDVLTSSKESFWDPPRVEKYFMFGRLCIKQVSMKIQAIDLDVYVWHWLRVELRGEYLLVVDYIDTMYKNSNDISPFLAS